MEMLNHSRIKQLMYLALFGLFIAWAGASYAAKTITVTVTVDSKIAKKMTVIGTGFSVNGKSSGGAGKRTTKTGPAGANYSFGFRSYRNDISCGSSVLNKNSMVILYYVGNKCTHKVVPQG